MKMRAFDLAPKQSSCGFKLFHLPSGPVIWAWGCILEISNSKPLVSKSKGFVFWAELVASSLIGLVTFVVLFANYCIGAEVYPLYAPKGVVCELLHRS